jgi:hypothetical protein
MTMNSSRERPATRLLWARQAEELLGEAVEQRAGVAGLEIGAPAAVDQQRITGEDAAHHAVRRGFLPEVAHAAGGVAGGVDRAKHLLAEADGVTVDQLFQRRLDVAAGRRGGVGASLQGELPGGGDVVGVRVGLDNPDQPRASLAQQRQVTRVLPVHRIDQQRLTRLGVDQQVGEGGRSLVEQLMEGLHGRFLLGKPGVPP